MARIIKFPKSQFANGLKAEVTIIERTKNREDVGYISSVKYSSLEDWLLGNLTTGFKKFRARFFGGVCLGEFKLLNGDRDFMKYYLIWCSGHKKYDVSYPKYRDGLLSCRDCDKERIKIIVAGVEEDDDLF